MKKILLLRTGQQSVVRKFLKYMGQEHPETVIDLLEPDSDIKYEESEISGRIIYSPEKRLNVNLLKEYKKKIDADEYSGAVFLINSRTLSGYFNIVRLLRLFKFRKIWFFFDDELTELKWQKRIECYSGHLTGQIAGFLHKNLYICGIVLRVKLSLLRTFFIYMSYKLFRRGKDLRTDEALLLIDRFPPYFHGGNIRWVKLISYLQNRVKFSVITGSNRIEVEQNRILQKDLLSELSEETNIVRVEAVRYSKEKFLGLFSIIDQYMLWGIIIIPELMKEIIRKSCGTLIVSVPSFGVAATACWLKKVFPINLIADLRDEWTLSELSSFKNYKTEVSRKWERRLLSAADHIVFTTEAQKILYSEHYPEVADKIEVITNGCDPADREKLVSEKDDSRGKPIVVDFFGTFNRDRLGGAFFEAVRKIKEKDGTDKFRFRFFGRVDPSFFSEINDLRSMIECRNIVDRYEMCRIIKMESDVLLTVASPESGNYIAGKSYEILLSGKPVAAFVPEGEAHNLFKKFEGVETADPLDAESIVEALNNISSYKEFNYDRREGLKAYYHTELAEQYFNLISSEEIVN